MLSLFTTSISEQAASESSERMGWVDIDLADVVQASDARKVLAGVMESRM